MEITEVKVFPIQEEKLKAFVSIVFDQCFMVNDIKIIQGRDGLFISMPSRKKKNGEFKDVAHPLNNETRRTIEDKILAEYQRILAERGETVEASFNRDPATPAPRRVETAPHAGASAGDAVKPSNANQPANAADAGRPVAEKTLEEIEEMHLRDSFWTVP